MKRPQKNEVAFAKMEGLGNDFVLLDARRKKLPLEIAAAARAICHRHLGVGADQLLILHPHRAADARLEIFNADGSRAGMCGNGLRCVALYLQRESRGRRRRFAIASERGLHSARCLRQGIEVGLGAPLLTPQQIPLAAAANDWPCFFSAAGRDWQGYPLGMGNPHCVLFVAGEGAALARQFGPAIEKLPLFPQRTNVEFVQRTGERSIRVDVWERGAGPTLACGSGACAAAVAALRLGYVKSPVAVEMPGGTLRVAWQPGQEVRLCGPARLCFVGSFSAADFQRLARSRA